jgi:phosphoglycolate phosphatase-like HAD superfamily hydrolase
MILAARDYTGVDLSGSWIIGDTVSDIAAGAAAGLAGGTLLAAADEPAREARALAKGNFVVERARDLAAAVAALIERGQFASQG